MVYRGLALALLLPLTVHATPSGEIPEMDRDEIRADAHRDILRAPADVDIDPDVAMVRAVMAPSPSAPSRLRQEPLPNLKLMVQPEGIRADQMLQLVCAATGYRVENPLNLPLEAIVRLSTTPRPVSRILAALETQARVGLSLYPEQKLIVVHKMQRHATR